MRVVIGLGEREIRAREMMCEQPIEWALRTRVEGGLKLGKRQCRQDHRSKTAERGEALVSNTREKRLCQKRSH